MSIGAGDLGFDYPADQIGQRVANGSPPLQRFFGAVLPRRLAAEMGPATCYTLPRNIASIMKIWFHFAFKTINISTCQVFARRKTSRLRDVKGASQRNNLPVWTKLPSFS